MKHLDQPYSCETHVDEEGNPVGGTACAKGLELTFQAGLVDQENGPNGVFVETVLKIARDRIKAYQGTRFSCRENAIAVTKIEEAIHWLDHRTRDRIVRGVENTHRT